MILAIDSNYQFSRAFYGLTKLKTSEGISSGGVFGVMQMLLGIKKKYPSAQMLMFWDAGSWRKQRVDFYKKSRSPKEDSYIKQIRAVQSILTGLCIPQLSLRGFEADDLIAWQCLHDPKDETIIYSGDTDLHQLVREGPYPVKWYNILKNALWDEQRIHSYYGIEPCLLPYVKALCGDSSDDIPGIRGIGEKTALKLIKTYGLWSEWNTETFTQMHKDKLRKGVADSIEESYDKLVINFELVDLQEPHGPGEIDLSENKLPLQSEMDTSIVVDIFRKYEFEKYIQMLGEFTTLARENAFTDTGLL